MNTSDIYDRIDKYLAGKKFDDSNRKKAAEAKDLICDMLNGKKPSSIQCSCRGCFTKEHTAMTDSELLLAVLKNCSEEVLLELEEQFGRKSRISNIIKDRILDSRGIKNDSTEIAIVTLEHMLEESEKAENKLYALICKYMEEKGFETDADFYNAISMSRQNFARIRNRNANIGKETVLWITCGLGLDYIKSSRVLSAAGYAFKPNDKRDVIISYIAKNINDYDINLVNDVLYHFNLRTFFDD